MNAKKNNDALREGHMSGAGRAQGIVSNDPCKAILSGPLISESHESVLNQPCTKEKRGRS